MCCVVLAWHGITITSHIVIGGVSQVGISKRLGLPSGDSSLKINDMHNRQQQTKQNRMRYSSHMLHRRRPPIRWHYHNRSTFGSRGATRVSSVQEGVSLKHYHSSSSSSSSSLSSSSTSFSSTLPIVPHHRSHLLFGANTDVGKSIVATGLVRANVQRQLQQSQQHTTHYIKPLQCGGSDQSFVEHHVRSLGLERNMNPSTHETTTTTITTNDSPTLPTRLQTQTLFSWDTPASPHLAARMEHAPRSDEQVIQQLWQTLADISRISTTNDNNHSHQHELSSSFVCHSTATYIETAGGVLSPSSSSPHNQQGRHAMSSSQQQSSWGWIPQADLYQPFAGQAPVVLVGDGRLGGISATLSALESLLLRGYDIAALIVIETTVPQNNTNNNDNTNTKAWSYENGAALKEYLTQRLYQTRSAMGEALLSIPQSIVSLPPIPTDMSIPLDEWFEETQEDFQKVDAYLQSRWEGQVDDLQSLVRSTAMSDVVLTRPQGRMYGDKESTKTTSSKSVMDLASVNEIQTLSRDESLKILQRNRWVHMGSVSATNGLGHGDSSLVLATAAAAGRYGTCFQFGNCVHAPAVELANLWLGSTGPGHDWAGHVVYTDSDAQSIELAIQMASRLYQKRTGVADNLTRIQETEWTICGQEGSYHGDTLATASVSELYEWETEGRKHPWTKSRGLFLDTPTLGYKDGVLSVTFPEGFSPSTEVEYTFKSMDRALDVDARKLAGLFSHYKELIEMQWLVYEHSGINRIISSVIIEPVVMTTGGMKLVDPLWQRALVDTARSRNAPVIFDETATGLFRLGVVGAKDILKVNPDVACYNNKTLGALSPLSALLMSEEMRRSFSAGADEHTEDIVAEAINRSYVPSPAGCTSTIHAMNGCQAYLACRASNLSEPRMSFSPDKAESLSRLPLVDESYSIGTILVVVLKSEDVNSELADLVAKKLSERGIAIVPQDGALYLSVSPLATTEECGTLYQQLYDAIVAIE